MLRRAVTQIWNKEQSYRVGIVFEYRDQEAYKACQALLEEHYLPAVEGLTTKVVGSEMCIRDSSNVWTGRPDVGNGTEFAAIRA